MKDEIITIRKVAESLGYPVAIMLHEYAETMEAMMKRITELETRKENMK